MKFFLDAGHGGNDSGAVGINDILEKNIVLDVTLGVKKEIEKAGHTVFLSRSEDKTLSLSERSNKANINHVDVVCSIHCNSFTSSSAKGFEIYHHVGSERGKELATSVLSQFKENGLFTINRGLKTKSLHMTREVLAPSILVELGFITNQEDLNLIINKKDEMIKAISKGLLDFYGLKNNITVSATSEKLYRVQVGAFKDIENAKALQKELKEKGYDTILV